MKNSRMRPRLATVVAVAAIGAVSFGLTGAGPADGKPKPAPTPSAQPVATMTIHPASGDPITVPVYSLQEGVAVGVSNPTGGPVREPSTPSVSEMTVTRKTDSTSPILFGYITHGRSLPEVDLAGSLPDGTPFKYVLSNVIISGLTTTASADSYGESLSLNFTRIKTSVGANSASYDIATAKAE